MKYWVTTDTHFGHDNMVQYCGRPENFAFELLRGFNMIGDDDILIHLGDVCIGNDADWHDKLSLFKFKKILVRGNHDKKSNSWYMSHGWDFVCDDFSLIFSGQNIVFSHAPRPIGKHDFNIHGHFHNNLHRLLESKWVVDSEEECNKDDLSLLSPKHINISVEETKYKPVLLDQIIMKTKYQ